MLNETKMKIGEGLSIIDKEKKKRNVFEGGWRRELVGLFETGFRGVGKLETLLFFFVGCLLLLLLRRRWLTWIQYNSASLTLVDV